MKTEKQRTKDTRENQPALPARVLASLADGIVVSDVAGQVTLINQAAAQMLGLDSKAALEQPVRTLLEPFPARGPSNWTDEVDRLYTDPYTDRRGVPAEVSITVGTQVVQARPSPVLTEAGEFLGVVTVLHDVTRDVEAEKARSHLILDVAHELRTPLTAIRGYSEMLLQQAAEQLKEQQRHFLRVIQRNADRLVTLINDLMDVNRIISNQIELDMRPVRMESIIREVVAWVEPQCNREDVSLSTEIERSVGSVLGDRDRLTQLITNLTGEALRRTPEGGRITLALSCFEGKVQFQVSDTGTAIPAEIRGEIFQRFDRLDAPSIANIKGTGLELPIAKMLSDMHGGHLELESEVEEGNVFTLTLPIYDVGGNEVKHDAESHTILVVEDDEDVNELLVLQLTQEGFNVLAARRGEEALHLARTRDVDLITLDIMLPDITGMDVLRRLKADRATADIPVIIVSMLRPDGSTVEAGALDHVTKPFTLERLTSSIRRTLTLT
jgi:PAS domain S-box-containing protein